LAVGSAAPRKATCGTPDQRDRIVSSPDAELHHPDRVSRTSPDEKLHRPVASRGGVRARDQKILRVDDPALGIRTQAFADFAALGRLAGKPLLRLGRRRRQRSPHYPVTPQKNTEISPLFECDSATRAFYGLKDGKITVNFSGWEQNRVVLEGAKPLR
jgi:hypothetical protein